MKSTAETVYCLKLYEIKHHVNEKRKEEFRK